MVADPFELQAAALAVAFDAKGWSGLLDSLAHEVGATGAMFAAVRRQTAEVLRSDVRRLDTDLDVFWREYDAEMHLHDRQRHAIAARAGPRVFTDLDHEHPDDGKGLEYLRWQEARLGVRHHLSFFTDLDDVSVGLSFHRTRSEGTAAEADRACLERIGRTLTSALLLSYRHAELVTDSILGGHFVVR